MALEQFAGRLYSIPYRRSIWGSEHSVNQITFGVEARRLHQDILREGLALSDMRTSQSVELRINAESGFSDDLSEPGHQIDLEWIESIASFSRPVPKTATSSLLSYFLDGSQQTLPGYHSAAMPIMASVTSAAILERHSAADFRIVPGRISLRKCWIVPLASGHDDVDAFIARVGSSGTKAVDPLAELGPTEYSNTLLNYAAIEQRALIASRHQRVEQELDLLETWPMISGGSDRWIVVDGALRQPVRRALGLVKSFTRQYVSGALASQLFQMPGGFRSPAFLVEDKWRTGRYTVWYVRLWDATGRDPRYGLVRLETAEPDLSSEWIDQLSRWVLAERLPRATNDSRWPTLLYPIYVLEQILKRYTARELRYWPG
ncbi:hypothetical protein BH23CHL5_BH23CHL5_20850 [soil metagenome]